MSQLATSEPKVMVPFKQGALMPDSMDGIHRLATGAWGAKVIPTAENVQQAFIILAAGFEAGLGFTATCKNVMLINNKPAIWGDAALALAIRSPLCKGVREWIEGEGDKAVAFCEAKRDGWAEPVVRTFSVADAKVAGKWNSKGPWSMYPKRMLAQRARGFALRDAFPDLLMGLGIVEEQENFERAAEAHAVVTTDTGTALESPRVERVALPEVPEEATAPMASDDEAQRAKDADGALFVASLNEPPVGTVGHVKK